MLICKIVKTSIKSKRFWFFINIYIYIYNYWVLKKKRKKKENIQTKKKAIKFSVKYLTKLY